MIDGIIKADGTSRLMRANLPATYEEFKAQAAAGTLPLDVLFNADGWSQPPTFLNKVNLLKDATAALFGLNADAVPDDVFGVLSPVVLHWWGKRTPDASNYEEVQTIWTNNMNISQKSSTMNWNVADDISIDPLSGVVSLKDPTATSINYGQNEATARAFFETLKGHYVNSPNVNSQYIFYFPADIPSSAATFTSGSLALSGSYAYSISSVYTSVPPSEWTFLNSSDRNAYPDSGVVEGYEYCYLGVPWENARLPIKFATGSYTGTGTFGISNQNSLTFDFTPQVVIILLDYNSDYAPERGSGMGAIFVRNQNHFHGVGNSYNNQLPIYIKWVGDTVFWYQTYQSNTNAAGYQLNGSGLTYRYFAIG